MTKPTPRSRVNLDVVTLLPSNLSLKSPILQLPRVCNVMLVTFEVTYAEGWWSASAHAPENAIYTQGKSVGELIDNILEATSLHYTEELEAGEQITIVTRYRSETREQESQIPSNFEYRVDIIAAAPGC
jgi:predicted RNase H-like HicB family nuclease